jgi:hypothetical protein
MQTRQFIGQDLFALERKKDISSYTLQALKCNYTMYHLYIVYYQFLNYYPVFVYPNAIIHNLKTHTAHHDIILPAKRYSKVVKGLISVGIVVSCKASFDLPSDKTIQSQLKVSKKNDSPVSLLIWLYLGNKKREEQYQGNVVFMNGNGCCNGLALDMFIMTKMLSSLNNKS